MSSLLSLDESQERAKALVCWSAAQRLHVHARFIQIFDQWRADWGLAMPADTVQTDVFSSAQARRALAFQIFGTAANDAIATTAYSPSSVAQSIVDGAWADWLGRLENAVDTGAIVEDHDSVSQDPWDGRMQIHLPWWEGIFKFGLEPGAVQQLIGTAQMPKPANNPAFPLIVPLHTAVANESVRVEVHFEPVSLTLGQIQSLRFGDVVALDHRMNAPMAVLLQGPEGPMQPFCQAWLGQREGQMAIELTP